MRIGPRKGLVANFLSLACEQSPRGNYFVFSDQDDIWEPDKLARAVDWLRNVPADIPALYCSRTRLIDAEGRAIGFSLSFRKGHHSQPSSRWHRRLVSGCYYCKFEFYRITQVSVTASMRRRDTAGNASVARRDYVRTRATDRLGPCSDRVPSPGHSPKKNRPGV